MSALEFLGLCVRLRKNIVISGGTGTGKTTLLNAVSTAIPEEERIVVIEDSSELRLAQSHCLYLESQQVDAFGRGGLNFCSGRRGGYGVTACAPGRLPT